MVDKTNPPVGRFINREHAYVGKVASSSKLGVPMVTTFNHLRRWRAAEYIASYSGRIDPAINGNHLSRFHIISRFPVRANADDAKMIINRRNWLLHYAAGNETWDYHKDYTVLGAPQNLSTQLAPQTTSPDTVNTRATGGYGEWVVDVEPEDIGTNNGFRCSRLDVDNAVVHRLNVFQSPTEPTIADYDDALIRTGDVAYGEVLRGWDEGNNDGTIGTLCHYMDGDSSDAVVGTDSIIHNTSRALLNTPYALGVYQTGAAGHTALRSDAAAAPLTYRVKPRNLSGAAGDISCDLAIVAWGGENSEIAFTSLGDTATFVMPAATAAPTLFTTDDFDKQLTIDPTVDYINITGKSAGALELHVQAVSLWEPYQYR